MGLFGRKAPPAPEPEPVALAQRRPALRCVGCNRNEPPFVYMENGHDYCVPCARTIYGRMGLRPAGRRPEDLTLADLLARET